MTDDPDVRVGFDDVLQICERYQSDGEMTSRERCQALLWEYQVAAATENEEALKSKTLGEQKHARSEHDKLMGSISVAASVKGFLKETAKPQERSHPLKIQKEKRQKGSASSARVRNEGDKHLNKRSTFKTVGEKPMDSMAETFPTKIANHGIENDTGRIAGCSEISASEDPASRLHDLPSGSIYSTPLGKEEKEPASLGTELQNKSLSLTEEQKDKLTSHLVSDQMHSSKKGTLNSGLEKGMTHRFDSQSVQERHEHKTNPPTPPVHHEAHIVFSPIAPAGFHQSVDGSRSNQVSTPTLIPIPIAVSAVNTSPVAPMWYMPAGVIPYGRPDSPYTYFVPIDPSVTSSEVSHSYVNEPLEGEHRTKNNSIQNGAREVRTDQENDPNKGIQRSSPTPSKIPRPTSTTQKSNDTVSRNLMDDSALPSRGRSIRRAAPKPRARTPSPSLGRRSEPAFNSPRSQTPPVRWTRSGVDMECQRLLGKSMGSMPSLRQSRPSSPQSRPGSPRSRRESGNSTPRSSRSSSPVSLLVSKFEDMSKTPEEDAARDHAKSVSSLLSKFGSSSLVPEDRMTKGQFKPNGPHHNGQNSGSTGPLKPASGSDREYYLDTENPCVDDPSASAESLGKAREVYRTGSGPARITSQDSGESLSNENMQRLSASLEALFRERDFTVDSTGLRITHAATDSLEGVPSPGWTRNSSGSDGTLTFNSKSQGIYRYVAKGYKNENTKTVCSDMSHGRTVLTDSKDRHLNKGITHLQELLETEPVRESIRTKNRPCNLVLTPEKDTIRSQSSHPIPSPNGMLEIPVNMAVMDSMNSESTTPLISPLTPPPDCFTFCAGTWMSDKNAHEWESAVGPCSLKDDKPSNVFNSAPLKSNMEPERDINPVSSRTEDALRRTPETRVKPGPPIETPPSPGKIAISPGIKGEGYVKRFERRVSKSGQSNKEPDSLDSDVRDMPKTPGPLSDGKSNSGLANPASPNVKSGDLYAGSTNATSRRSPTPTGRDFVAYSSPVIKSPSPGNPTPTTAEQSDEVVPSSRLMATKRNSLPKSSGGYTSNILEKDDSNLTKRTLLSQSNLSLRAKSVITKTRSLPMGPAENLSDGQISSKEHPNLLIGKRSSVGGVTSYSLSNSKDRDHGRGNAGNVDQEGDHGSRLDLHRGRKPNLSLPRPSNTRTTKKHPSAPTTPNTVNQNKILDLPFTRRQSSPATSTLGIPKTHKHKVKTSSNRSIPISSGHSRSNFSSSSGSRPPSSESLMNTTFPGSSRHSWKGSEGNVTSEGSSNIPSSPEMLKKRGTYATKYKYSPGSSTGSSPLTSPPGSFSKSVTRDQMFHYSHKRGSVDSDFFNPKDTEVPGASKRNSRIPSSSSSDSGFNQSGTDDSKSSSGFIHSGTHSPVSPKFPVGLRIFYEPTGGQENGENGGPASDTPGLPSQTNSVSSTTKDLSTDVQRRGSSEAKQEPYRATKARHSSSSGDESVRLLTKKSSSGSSRNSLRLNNLGDSDSGTSSRTNRRSSSSSCPGEERSKRSAKSPTSPRNQSPRPDSTTALGKSPPSPGRVDSKELLGQLMKKVLTSAAAKQGTSPLTSFSDKNTTPAKERDKRATSPQRKASNPLVENVVAKPDESTSHSKCATPRKESLHEADQRNKRSLANAQGARPKSSTPGTHPDRAEPLVISDQGTSASKEPSIVCSNASTVESSSAEVSTSDEGTVLSKLIDMIHDEFALDGYLEDGVEDVNMAEYVLSLAGMSRDNFKEAITDQYNDLYWDEDLLHNMFKVVAGDLQPKTPTLQFSESSVSDLSMQGSVDLSREGSFLGTDSLYLNCVSRSSSERSANEARDILMTSMGEPTEFLPIKIIAPEIIRDIQEELTPIFEDYHKEMNVKLSSSIEELTDKLGTKILEISQQLLLERRAKKKNINSFNKLLDMENKKDAKDLASKLLKEIEESDRKIIYLKNVQRRMRNVYCERFGLDISLLHSFVSSYRKDCLTLDAQRSNDFLNFSPSWDHRNEAGSDVLGESNRGPNLQYGTQKGLFSYLFGRHAMIQVFVRYFLYTFRYCATAKELFAFIRDKCAASLRVDSTGHVVFNHQLQIRYRALDLLAEWIDGYYFYDFKNNLDLVKELLVFVRDELILVDRSERGNYLVELIAEKQKQDKEIQATENDLDTVAVLQMEDTQGLSMIDNLKDSPKKHLRGRRKSKYPLQCFKRGTPEESSGYKATLYLKAMSVTDHSHRTLAEHLTLIQQDIFSRAHSIHFLNSRALGIGVGRSQSPNKERESIFGFSAGSRRASEFVGSDNTSGSPQHMEAHLFVGELNSEGCLEELLEHAQDVSMWVAVEICSASSTKSQLALITKFVSIAKYCCQMRNFATCVQIVDSLEMFVVRQLPVWKNIPNKTTELLEELKVIKVLLKTDSQWLMRDDACRVKPTLPCVLLFLMHIQQLEIGGFTLANGMYKWTKMRSIGRLIDQIRLFKQMRYAFEADKELKDRLQQRLTECKKENLHALASENTSNFHSNSSHGSKKFQNTLKKMKATFGQG